MKLKALALVLVLAGYGVANAGMDPTNSFTLGLEAGANFATLVGSDVTDFKSALNNKLGFVGGGFLCLNFGSSFAIRPEVLYEQKGTAINGQTTTPELDYIEVPVLLKLSLGTPVVNPGILIGPSFAWNILAQNLGSGTSVNSSDVGLVGGVEVDIDKFLVNGRYELGLDNVTQNSKIQNGTFTFLIGYSLM